MHWIVLVQNEAGGWVRERGTREPTLDKSASGNSGQGDSLSGQPVATAARLILHLKVLCEETRFIFKTEHWFTRLLLTCRGGMFKKNTKPSYSSEVHANLLQIRQCKKNNNKWSNILHVKDIATDNFHTHKKNNEASSSVQLNLFQISCETPSLIIEKGFCIL